MAAWEPKKQGIISQVSWTDGTAQDVYYGQEHSFQYAANINCDDEMHGIKLANRIGFTSDYAKCQLISCGEHWVMALPIAAQSWEEITIKTFQYNGHYATNPWQELSWNAWKALSSKFDIVPGVVFQDKFWFWANVNSSQSSIWTLSNVSVTGSQIWPQAFIIPYDHADYTDESIMTVDTNQPYMQWAISAILNYNNTRLVVAVWGGTQPASIWVYYPELERLYNQQHPTQQETTGKVGWKKVLEFEAWTTIVWLTCSFEYLKVRCVDEWWNTKIYYYQGNNNLRSTFVYNVVDLIGERVLRVYSINWTDYYITSIDWTDWYVNLNKMVWNIPVQLLHQRAWLTYLDVNFKAPYFVGPVSINAAYKSWRFYIWDQYWVFQFTQNQQWFDKWYMKWKLRDSTTYDSWQPRQVYWLCENKGFLYVSDSRWCWAMRLYDTWVDGYEWWARSGSDAPSFRHEQPYWVLISREYEWKEGWTITKMLDEIRLNYELNPLISLNWEIDVYVSPNNLWRSTDPESEWWYHVMHIDQTNWQTRTERSNLLNKLDDGDSAFTFDWQTITYAIKITCWEAAQATPIVRQIDIKYHTKDKVNNVYDINTPD